MWGRLCSVGGDEAGTNISRDATAGVNEEQEGGVGLAVAAAVMEEACYGTAAASFTADAAEEIEGVLVMAAMRLGFLRRAKQSKAL